MNDPIIDEINKAAKENGVYPSKAALMVDYAGWRHQSFWPSVKNISESQGDMDVDLIGSYDCEFTRMVKMVAERQKFPVNTTFLHSLGVVGAMTLRRFNVQVWDTEAPCTIYTCCSQPSGSGKSPVHGAFANAIYDELKKINEHNAKEKRKLKIKIDEAKAQLKSESNGDAKDAIMEDIFNLEFESAQFNKIKYMVKNATPQALEEVAQANGGSWSVVSDEKEAMDRLLGTDFGAGEATQDFGLMLSGYDGGYYESLRITREGFNGASRGSINVMAQKSTVEKLLHVGSKGRGINERFYLLCEPPRFDEALDKWMPLPNDMKNWYESIVDNVLNTFHITLDVRSSDMDKMLAIANKNRTQFVEGGYYDNNMIRGFVAKKQMMIIKVASILHIMRHWSKNGDRAKTIDSDCVQRAIYIDSQLTDAYRKALYDNKHGGVINQSLRVVDYLDSQVQKGKIKDRVAVRKIYDSVRKSQEFSQLDECMSTLKNKVLKQLEEYGYGFEYKSYFYLNPKFKD